MAPSHSNGEIQRYIIDYRNLETEPSWNSEEETGTSYQKKLFLTHGSSYLVQLRAATRVGVSQVFSQILIPAQGHSKSVYYEIRPMSFLIFSISCTDSNVLCLGVKYASAACRTVQMCRLMCASVAPLPQPPPLLHPPPLPSIPPPLLYMHVLRVLVYRDGNFYLKHITFLYLITWKIYTYDVVQCTANFKLTVLTKKQKKRNNISEHSCEIANQFVMSNMERNTCTWIL